ncbi:ribonuclease HII [Emcibacter sp. SYSU 3D8]|uniref:ribonuclease HII n=1 Tax=Emcibacter sp. SYSU 3D8 TaxID=3133969 RepID=UPI0031FEFDF1
MELEIGGMVAGVDEAGRGPLAGPVVAAAVILDIGRLPDGIDDSKKVPRERREMLHGLIAASAQVGVGMASVEEIDSINILQATLLAMTRAIEALPVAPHHVLIDGNRQPGSLPCACRTVIRGDAISLSIAAASIIAKVTRDRIMTALALDHPHYGWERNAGYGTPEHQRALSLVGISPHHRRSFEPIYRLMNQDSRTSN